MSITGERANNKASKAADQLNTAIVTLSSLQDPSDPINDKSLSGKREGAVVHVRLPSGVVVEAVAQGAERDSIWSYPVSSADLSLKADTTYVDDQLDLKLDIAALPDRKKIEVLYTGLTLAIPTTVTNLVTLLKALTPVSGSLSNFINTTSNKLNVYNDNSSVLFKLNIKGSWTTASQSRSMVLDFVGTSGNTLTVTRVDNTTPDVVQFFTYFSVDKDGNLATNGSAPTIQSNGSVFTATSILLTVEQVTAVSSITPV